MIYLIIYISSTRVFLQLNIFIDITKKNGTKNEGLNFFATFSIKLPMLVLLSLIKKITNVFLSRART